MWVAMRQNATGEASPRSISCGTGRRTAGEIKTTMDEQQRVFVALGLCMAILFLWPVVFPSQETPALQGAEQAAEGKSTGESPSDPSERDLVGGMADRSAAKDGPDGAAEAAPENVRPPERSRTFDFPALRGSLSNRSGHLESLELKDFDEVVGEGEEERRVQVNLVAQDGVSARRQGALELDFGEGVEAPWLDFEGDGLVLAGENANAAVRLSIKPSNEPYQLRYSLTVRNVGSRALAGSARLALALQQSNEERGMLNPAADVVSALCYVDGSVEREFAADLIEEPVSGSKDVLWVGIDRQYFVIAAVPDSSRYRGEEEGIESEDVRCELTGEEKTATASLVMPLSDVAPGQTWERSWTVFAGPKRGDALAAVQPTLGKAIEYDLWGIPLGAIARPMVLLLRVFHGWVGNWGLAIFLLTFTVKLALFPITYKSQVSMRRMQLLRPELDKLKEKYPDDRERQQLEQIKLFKEKGVNPLGGCLPLFLQMPIWFALYRSLWTNVDLYQESFLWLADLTAPEPFPVLALTVGAVTFLQQRLQPMAVDNQQMKVMMYMMPVMFTFFMFALPSGLVLYILVNSALTIVQQLAINRRQG